MKRVLLSLVLAAGMMASGLAQEPVESNSDDPRFSTILYAPDRVFTLAGAPGYVLAIELSPDEQIQSIALGDSGAWAAVANRKGDHLFVKPLQAGVSTNMTVVTSVRTYHFELASGGSEAAINVRFRYPNEAASGQQVAESEGFVAAHAPGRYRISGDKLLRPSSVTTDGRRTYLSWPSDRALPAVFAVDEDGRELVVDGMMRDDVMVIDWVVPKLLFRIDRRTARAERTLGRRRG